MRSFLRYKLRGRLGPDPTSRGFSAAPGGLDPVPEAVRRDGVRDLARMSVEKHVPRVLFANHPRLMREMLMRACRRLDEVEVVGEVHILRRLPFIVEMLDPDCVIVSLYEDGTFPDVVKFLHQRRPEIGVVGISSSGRYVQPMGDRSPCLSLHLNDLISLIHSA